MMWEVISELIEQSFKNKLFPKALECIKALRTGCIQEDEWQKFNEGTSCLRSVLYFSCLLRLSRSQGSIRRAAQSLVTVVL